MRKERKHYTTEEKLAILRRLRLNFGQCARGVTAIRSLTAALKMRLLPSRPAPREAPFSCTSARRTDCSLDLSASIVAMTRRLPFH